jgi:hypothetical protein
MRYDFFCTKGGIQRENTKEMENEVVNNVIFGVCNDLVSLSIEKLYNKTIVYLDGM